LRFFSRRRGLPCWGSDLSQVNPWAEAPIDTTLFIPLSAAQSNLATDWAAACAEVILRRCPICDRDSITGHGRRQKQAHDEQHDWIAIRRGYCKGCKKSFTFLPPFSLPYTHYSLLARSQALYLRFVKHCTWESAAPAVKDPHRVANPATLRRWCRSLDCSEPPFSFLCKTMAAVSQWLSRGDTIRHGPLRLSWHTLAPFLHQLWPWPLRL
jgi:hypothetical protein